MLIEESQKKMKRMKMNEKMMESEKEQNKEVEFYPRVLSVTAKKENNAARYSQKNNGIKESTHKEPLRLRSCTRRNQPSVNGGSIIFLLLGQIKVTYEKLSYS